MTPEDEEDIVFDDPDLFEWSHARRGDPPTSFNAASDTKFRAARTKLRILTALAKHGPQTADGLKDILSVDCHQRVSDLWKIDHMIEDTGERRDSDRGSSMMVFAINARGRDKLAGKI